jgi:hypothetical protein
MSEVTCPRCGSKCDLGQARCPRCGGYLGARRRAPVPAVPPEPEAGVPAALRPVLWLLELFPGFVRPKVVVLSVVALPVAAGLVLLGVAVFSLGAVFSGMAIAAFGMVIYWTAVAWLMHGEVCMPAEALAEFDGTKWMIFLLLGFAPLSALFIYAGTAGGPGSAGGS